jgi:hypothetical protein
MMAGVISLRLFAVHMHANLAAIAAFLMIRLHCQGLLDWPMLHTKAGPAGAS